MAETNDFVNGLFVKKQKFQSGGYVIKVSFKVADFKRWLDENKEADNEYINIMIASAKSDENKMYAKKDTWKPDPSYKKPEGGANSGADGFSTQADSDGDLPF